MTDEPSREGRAGSTSSTLAPDIAQLIERALPGSRSETSRFLAGTAHVRRVRREEMIFR